MRIIAFNRLRLIYNFVGAKSTFVLKFIDKFDRGFDLRQTDALSEVSEAVM